MFKVSRKLLVVTVLAIIVATAATILKSYRSENSKTTHDLSRHYAQDLPKKFYKGTIPKGSRVLVDLFRSPDAEGYYRAGNPVKNVPPSILFQFRGERPEGKPRLIEGNIERMDYDLVIRPDGTPGLLVISDCVVLESLR